MSDVWIYIVIIGVTSSVPLSDDMWMQFTASVAPKPRAWHGTIDESGLEVPRGRQCYIGLAFPAETVDPAEVATGLIERAARLKLDYFYNIMISAGPQIWRKHSDNRMELSS